MGLLDSSSVLAHLTLKRAGVNLLDQQEHLVFLLARTRELEVNVQQFPKLENAFPDLERQLSHLTPTVVDGGDPMRKLKLVEEEEEEEEAVVKNIRSFTEGRVNEGGGGGRGSLTVYLL